MPLWIAFVLGRQIGSVALIADGKHARTDGFTSLAVIAGVVGTALGFPLADPIVGLVITAAILVVLVGAARDVFRRLMDGVDPQIVGSLIDGIPRLVTAQVHAYPGHYV